MMNRGAVLLSESVGSDAGKRRELCFELRISTQTIRNWLGGAFLPSIRHRRLLEVSQGISFDAWDEPSEAVAA